MPYHLLRFVETPRRLPQSEPEHHCQDHARHTYRHEGAAPAQKFVDPATHQKPGEHPERDPHSDDRHGRGAALRGEIIGNKRIGGWVAAGLPYADPDAGQKQGDKACSHSAHRGHSAPQAERYGNDIAAIIAIGQPGNGYPEQGIKHRKGHSAQHAQFRIAEAELLLDRLQQYREDLPIHEIEERDNQEQKQHIAAITIRDPESYGIAPQFPERGTTGKIGHNPPQD